MLTDHPKTEDLEGFLRSASRTSGAARNTQILRHLLAGCDACRETLRSMGWDEHRLERLLAPSGARPAPASAGSGYNYDQAFARAEQSLEAFFAAGKPAEHSPESLLDELEALAADEQIRRVSADGRFASTELVNHLIEVSHEARYTDPDRMAHLALLARLAADACTVETMGSGPRLADLRMRAWGHYGNALRVCGRLREAEESLGTAEGFRKEGTSAPPLRARLFEQIASLRMVHSQYDSAIELDEEACQIYRELGEPHLLASALVQKAIALLYAGEPESAVLALNRAIPLIDHEADPHLLLAACHNLVRCYIDLDRPDQALAIYSEVRELYREFNDPLILLRAAWQEGQLLRDLGHPRAAEMVLLGARKGFMEKGLAHEVALVSLDLSTIYVNLGLVEELRQTVTEAIPIFRALGVDREALAALLQLRQIAGHEQQALELIRFLNARVQPLPKRAAIR